MQKTFLGFALSICWLLFSTTHAQRYNASLQFSSGGAFRALVVSSQFELSYNPFSELTLGAKVGTQSSAVGAALSLRVNPYLFYRLLLVSSQTWFFTGYSGINLSYNSGGGVVLVATAKPKKEIEDEIEDLPITSPIPTPTETGFQATALFGVDGAWFLDDLNSLYFGLETDLIIFPNLNFTVYPYLEYDIQVFDVLTVALGGYVGISTGFTYNLYAYGIYNLSGNALLRLELSFNGGFLIALRWTIKG